MTAGKNQLSLFEIARGMAACRSNAQELIGEAELLRSNKHFARAFALYFTAGEELGKFSVLELCGRKLFTNSKVNWKGFWQRFRSHDSKAAQLNVQLLYLALEPNASIGESAVAAFETIASRGLAVRNSALYVDTDPDFLFRKPSDIDFSLPLPVLAEVATAALKSADRRGKTVDEIGHYLSAKITRDDHENFVRLFTKLVTRLREDGVPKEDVLKKIDQSYKA